MSLTPVGGHPQGWDHKLADRSSLPPASGEEKCKPQSKHVFSQPSMPKAGAWGREETEGSSASSPSSGDPPYLRWARTLHDLLEDEEGVRQFRKFVSGAGGLHLDRLNFYFAVQGLRQEAEPSKVRQVISAIYKFLRKSQLSLPEDVRAQVKVALRDGLCGSERSIFDGMEAEVTRAIATTTYPAFLRSDIYVGYVGAATRPLSSPDPPAASGSGLATLHEGEELRGPPARLTHDALLASQRRRLHDPAPSRKRSVYAPHLSYAGFTPASRVDSERASLSSGRTDSDAVSLSGSSIDGMSILGGRDRTRPRIPGIDRHTFINRDPDTAMMIPRTQRMQTEQMRLLPPPDFAKLLIEKLERVRRDQDSKDRLERRLTENDGEEMAGVLPPALVAAAIREKLQLDDDNDQDILDQHVSRVWSERTPGGSPPRRPRPRRRPPSTLSADSGHYDDPHSSHAPHAAPRRCAGSGTKKTAPELTDSGVSVISDEPGSRVLQWMDAARKPRPRAAPSAPDHTVLVLTFLDEPVPYRIKVPAAPLSLRTFKEYLPRRGSYRYFFKTECAELDNAVIQQEVTSDSDLLPLYEGKVMAKVKAVE